MRLSMILRLKRTSCLNGVLNIDFEYDFAARPLGFDKTMRFRCIFERKSSFDRYGYEPGVEMLTQPIELFPTRADEHGFCLLFASKCSDHVLGCFEAWNRMYVNSAWLQQVF